MTARPGILAVWNDRNPQIEDFYEQWYVHQHLPERVALAGWRFGRRYEALSTEQLPRFFTYYETASVASMFSAEYVARLNAPTPETIEIMHNWSNMTRTSCELAYQQGNLFGAFACVARFVGSQCESTLVRVAAQALATGSRAATLPSAQVVAAQCWINQSAHRLDTAEAEVRGTQDKEISAGIVIDCMRESDALTTANWLSGALANAGVQADAITVYRFLCEYRAETQTAGDDTA